MISTLNPGTLVQLAYADPPRGQPARLTECGVERASLDWHDARSRNTSRRSTGTLEFITRDAETFLLAPGDVLVATDTAGSGHRWRLIDDHPWRRCYVVLKPGAGDRFSPKS